MKLSNDDPKQVTPHKQLIEEILDSRIAKNEHGWAAKREIERLLQELTLLRAVIYNRRSSTISKKECCK